MPVTRLRSAAGQASAEYVAVLALVALVLAGAGVAVAAPDLPAAIVARLRLALCIVGGDVCRSSDAAARGLDPCVKAWEHHGREAAATILLLRLRGGPAYSIERRSDGSALVSASDMQGVDVTAGVGVSLGPVLRAGADVAGGIDYRPGVAWELPDEPSLRRFLARMPDPYGLGRKLDRFVARLPEPTFTFRENGIGVRGRIAASIGKGKARLLRFRPVDVELRDALGWREGPVGDTFYFDLGKRKHGVLAGLVPGLPSRGRELFELRGDPRPMAVLRRAEPGERDGEAVELVGRLALSQPGDLEAAVRYASTRGRTALAGGDLERRMRARGTVERHVYRERTTEDGWDYSIKLLAKAGLDQTTTVTRRRLVDAQVLDGPRPLRRADCLGP